jgi:deoxyribonuclease-4
VDRHEHIGKGKIGLEGFKAIVRHPKLHKIPMILETPKEQEGDDRRNMGALLKLSSKS